MANITERIPSSARCPQSRSAVPTCAGCAWGIVTPQGVGQGERIAPSAQLIVIGGYNSSCGRVAVAQDDRGRTGAIRGNRFFPGIQGNEAYERYLAEESLR
jgi:hypothetical protein